MKQELKILNAPTEVSKSSFNSLLNLNKKSISDISIAIEQSVSDGHEDPLKALILAKKLQELGKSIEEKVKDFAIDESRLSKGEVYKTLDVEVTQRDIGVRYNFSKCGHSKWEDLNREFLKIKSEKDEIEKTLKTVTKPLTMIDDETGEVVEINPPVRSGKTGLVLTIK